MNDRTIALILTVLTISAVSAACIHLFRGSSAATPDALPLRLASPSMNHLHARAVTIENRQRPPTAPAIPVAGGHGETDLVVGGGLDDTRIDRLLADASDFTAMVNAMHTAASTDRELTETTSLFSSHLRSSLAEEGHARTVLDFSCGRQLCLAQLSDAQRAPLNIRPLMQHDGATVFQAAIVSDQVKTLNGTPSLRAVFAIDPAINQIVSIPD